MAAPRQLLSDAGGHDVARTPLAGHHRAFLAKGSAIRVGSGMDESLRLVTADMALRSGLGHGFSSGSAHLCADVGRCALTRGWGTHPAGYSQSRHTGGALVFEPHTRRRRYRAADANSRHLLRGPNPPRCGQVTGRARPARCRPQGRNHAEAPRPLSGSYDCGDVIASDLCNVIMVVHRRRHAGGPRGRGHRRRFHLRCSELLTAWCG